MFVKVLLFASVTAALLLGQEPAGRGAGGGRGRGGTQPQARQQIKPGLIVITGAGANSEVRVTPEGLIVVDGKLPGEPSYNGLLEQIKAISPLPIRYLIVTHHHQDHTGNNDRFLAAGVPIVAHENLNKNLADYQATPKPASATVTYTKEYTIRLGGVAVEAHYFGRAHTSGDTVVYFPDLKVVAVSDIITTGTTGPLADYAGGGSFLEWPATIEGILSLDFDTAIPGNGGPLTRADLQEYKTKIETFVSRARQAARQGVPKDQLLDHIETGDLGWKPRVPNVDPFYAELMK
ncbi:MAG: MBL fold metallo-hydrolase [Acidobacteriia bacterium]|nr:MBL fold metallo-hydrolase [Terriglobia bacterium]